VREWAEAELGAPVAGARTLAGGMSPGCAVRLTGTGGQAAFLKAQARELTPGPAGLPITTMAGMAARWGERWRQGDGQVSTGCDGLTMSA